jgi:hypothetical protein
VVHGFIKPEWSAQIKIVKVYPLDLISVVGLHVEDSGHVSFVGFVRPKRSTGAPWPPA